MCEGKWGEIPVSHQQHGSTAGVNTWTVYLSDLLLSCLVSAARCTLMILSCVHLLSADAST